MTTTATTRDLRSELLRVLGDDWDSCEPAIIATANEIPDSLDDDDDLWMRAEISAGHVIVWGGQDSFAATSHDPASLLQALQAAPDCVPYDDDQPTAAMAAGWDVISADAISARV